MARVKAMPCICCRLLMRAQVGPTEVHHVRANGEPRNNWLVIPLCWDCHQGDNGVEKRRTYLAILKLSEWALLAYVIADLMSKVPR